MYDAEQMKFIATFLIGAIEGEIPITKKMLAAVPESQAGFKLGDKGRTAKDLMWHIVESDIWFCDGIAAGEFSMPESAAPAPNTAAEIVAYYEKNFPAALGKVKALSGEQLAKPINFFNAFNMPAGMYLNFLSAHSIHHRGQLSTYVRAMNARVPSIYGGSADEPFEAPATAKA
ncbi:MAG: DinB family protein [Bryobacteraceae bacterium]